MIPLQPGDDLLLIAGGQCTVSTASHMVNRLAVVRPGDPVLVPSAPGGVGSALVQCAKLAGARVIATTGSLAKRELIESLGADQVVLRESDTVDPASFTKALVEAGGRGSTRYSTPSPGCRSAHTLNPEVLVL